MKRTSSHTGLIIIVVVIVLAVFGYFYVEGGAPAPTTGLVAGTVSGDVGLAEVNLLNQLQNIRIDTSLFQDPAYLSLIDHTVAIPPQNVGRPNPFAPVPGVGNPNDIQKK